MNCRTEIFLKVVQFRGGCGIITSDIKFAESEFCCVKARLAERRKSENILPSNPFV